MRLRLGNTLSQDEKVLELVAGSGISLGLSELDRSGVQLTIGATGDGDGSTTLPFLNMNDQGLHQDGTTDDAVAINALLAALGPGTATLGKHSYGLSSPIIIPNGVTLDGVGAMQGGSTLQPTSSFPHTTISGDQTVPADADTNSFTLTVAATAGFPLGSGGITPPTSGAQTNAGVLCVAGITIYYTGTTSTTFTGCRVGTADVSTVLADGRNVSTFLVWLNSPAGTGGFGTRIQNIGIDLKSVAGISGIHSCHVQEGGGWNNMRITTFANFGVRIDENPHYTSSPTAQHPTNYEWGKCWIIFASGAENEAVGIDVMHWAVGNPAGPKIDADRGGYDVSFVVQGNTNIVGKAAIRLNGATGQYGRFHIENMHTGVLVGDKYRSDVLLESVNIGSSWGNGTDDAGVVVGAIAGNSVNVLGSRKANAVNVPNRQVVKDLGVIDPNTGLNFRSTDETVDYQRFQGGSFHVNGSPQPTNNIVLVQDNCASGARDNSASTTCTVTFTAPTSVGNRAILASMSSGNFTLSSVTDSRGNTWTDHKVGQHLQGVVPGIASCPITIAHQIGDTLTLTFNGSAPYSGGVVSEWAGIAATSPVDVTVSNSSSSGTGSTGVTSARTNAEDLLFGAIAYNNAANDLASGTYIDLTTLNSGAGNRKVSPIYKVVQSTGTEGATWGGPAPGSWDAIMVAFKAAPAAKGTILVYNGSRYVRLPVGADGTVLTASSAAAAGVAWA